MSELQTETFCSQPDETLLFPTWQLPGSPPVRSCSDAELAYQKIREGILTLEFPPGTGVKDRALMEQYDLGRTPIREALKRLEVEGLIESHHRQGTYVRKISLQDIKQQYQIRRQLLSLAAALAAQAGTKDLIPNPGRLFRERVTDQQDLAVIIRMVSAFHLGIGQAAGNRYLQESLLGYCGHARRAWMMLRKRLSSEDFRLDEYQEIYHWIQEGRAEKASSLMADHVDRVHLVMVDCFLKMYLKG